MWNHSLADCFLIYVLVCLRNGFVVDYAIYIVLCTMIFVFGLSFSLSIVLVVSDRLLTYSDSSRYYSRH